MKHYNLLYIAKLSIPDNYILNETGLLWYGKPDLENLCTETGPTPGTKKIVAPVISSTYQFAVNVNGIPAGKTIRGVIYAKVTDKETQQSGFMLSGRNKKGNSTTTFVKAGIYGRDEVTDEKTQKTSYIYYIDKSKFKEGDAIVNTDDGEKFVIGDTEVLEGVYCINQGYAVFRRIEILDENEEYAVVSKETYNGLVRYDRIVKNADKVSEQDILY